MNLFEQWQEIANTERSQQETQAFWADYFQLEKNNYAEILGDHTQIPSGSIKALAEKFEMDSVTFMGFLDGINTSLEAELPLETFTEDSEIELKIDFEKLLFNMHEAKADWLFNLPQWEQVLPLEKRQEIQKNWRASKTVRNDHKIGRNDPCPCGSGKKYKKCCGANE